MKTTEKFGLSVQTILSLKQLFTKYPEIEKVIIYGSRAKGNFRNGSDIDLAVVAPSWQLEQILKLENEIEDMSLPYKVDVSLFHSIENKDLIEHINRVGKKFE